MAQFQNKKSEMSANIVLCADAIVVMVIVFAVDAEFSDGKKQSVWLVRRSDDEKKQCGTRSLPPAHVKDLYAVNIRRRVGGLPFLPLQSS